MNKRFKIHPSLFLQTAAWGGGVVLAFSALDALWLKALPWFDLSFGPVRFSFGAFAFVRVCLFLAWVLLMARVTRRQAKNSAAGWVRVLALVNLLLLGLGLYGFALEPFHLTVTHLAVPAPGMSRPVRIVQLSDLHVERTTSRERELVGMVAAQQPDLIVLTGDYLNLSYLDDPQAVADLRTLVGQLHAPLGVYAVNGTVENPARARELFAGLEVRVLDDEVAHLETPGGGLALVGVSDRHNEREDSSVLATLMSGVQPGEFSILLYHNPDLAYAARDAQVSLYFAGHTHGGQVRLPVYGAIFTLSRFGKTFEQGRYQVGATTLYVNRGIGMEGSIAPRARFLAPPEILCADLAPAALSPDH